MTKTKTMPPAPDAGAIKALCRRYRLQWLKMSLMQQELKLLRQEIAALAEPLLAADPAGPLSMHASGCTLTLARRTAVLVPEALADPASPLLRRFCKAHPGAVRLEMVKSRLGGVDLDKWGLRLEEVRVLTVTVDERGEQ